MKRRKFIRYSAVGFVGPTILTSVVSPFLTSCSNADRNISVALIGCGNEAVNVMADTFSGIENLRLKAVFDENERQAEQAVFSFHKSLGYRPEQFVSLQTVLNDRDIEAVFLFLPKDPEMSIAMQFIEDGKHVYLNNEPTFNSDECRLLSDAAEKNKRIVQCGLVQRSNPGILGAKAYIDEGKLGQVVHLKVFDLQMEIGENNIGPAAVRSLDLARFMAGNPELPSAVCGYRTGHRQVVTWDFEKFTINYETGSAYSYMQLRPAWVKGSDDLLPWLLQANRIEVYGSQGLLHLDPINGSWQVQGHSGEVLDSMSGTTDPAAHMHDFMTAVRTGGQPVADVKQGQLSVSLAHLGNATCNKGNMQIKSPF